MEAMDDLALLREYAARNSETAFETLVSRRAGFVYSAALRQVRDPHLAEDVTQAVFIILAQKAARISQDTILTGWLFKTTRFAALAQTRAAAKRREREQEAQMQTEIQHTAPDPLWEQMSPMLDEALASLGDTDRQAVLLRFFENKGLAEVGSALKTSGDTARKRVARALEKLRKYFSKRGMVSTAEIIAAGISANSVQGAPPGLAITITATALKGSAIAASTLTLVKGTLNLMAWIKAKIAVVIGASTLLVGTTILTLHAQEQRVREQEQRIRAEEQQIRAQEQQANLSPAQRQVLEDRLQQLRGQQDQLRARQNQLRNQDTNAFTRPSLQLSPFSAVRFDGEKVIVNYSGAEYELAAIDDLTTPSILAFCHGQYRDLWQKRFAEDLVVVLADMKHPLNADHTVGLTLLDSATGEKKNIEKALMTAENRQAIMKIRLADDAAKAAQP
jgi:RNA polymerase sigma factor (sigma-70 family)